MTDGPTMRIAMVVYGDISHDSRVQREANSLTEAGHAVTLFCLAGSHEQIPALDSRVEVIVRVPTRGAVIPGTPSPFRAARQGSPLKRIVDKVAWLSGYTRNLRAWGRTITTSVADVDAWHVHDFAGLVAIGGQIGDGPRLIYDIHDLFVETGTAMRLPRPVRWAIRQYERRLFRRVDLAVAVNRPLAAIVQERNHPKSMIVVHNCPPRWDPPQPRPNLIREVAHIPPDAPIVLYHGLLGGNRGLETLADAILLPGLEHVHLALLGYGQLRETLAERAREERFQGRLHVLDAVPPADLLPWVASADVGSLAMPRASVNLYISTPNKLFECLTAGTPVVVSDFPAVTDIVADDPLGPLGAICDPADPVDVGRAILSLLSLDEEARADLRRRCATAARERWSWESEVARLVAAYGDLAATRSGATGGSGE